MSTIHELLHAIGVGRPGETHSIRPHQRRLFRSMHLTPWSRRMRFGWVLCWDGPYWHNAVGIAGPDWDGGDWLGGMSWRKRGPFVICRSRRRGSLRSDRSFARAMGCTCAQRSLLWPINHVHPTACPLTKNEES